MKKKYYKVKNIKYYILKVLHFLKLTLFLISMTGIGR